MKTYQIVCPSCDGYGYINETNGMSSNTQRVCPACNGSKTVMVCETKSNDCESIDV